MSGGGPLVSVIVLSWNSAGFLEGCLESVLAQKGVEVEAIVVDNASSDGSTALVRGRFPGVILLENKENLGFCGGNNVGLTLARGVYILFLNAGSSTRPAKSFPYAAPPPFSAGRSSTRSRSTVSSSTRTSLRLERTSTSAGERAMQAGSDATSRPRSPSTSAAGRRPACRMGRSGSGRSVGGPPRSRRISS
jgi:hypothetical protein